MRKLPYLALLAGFLFAGIINIYGQGAEKPKEGDEVQLTLMDTDVRLFSDSCVSDYQLCIMPGKKTKIRVVLTVPSTQAYSLKPYLFRNKPNHAGTVKIWQGTPVSVRGKQKGQKVRFEFIVDLTQTDFKGRAYLDFDVTKSASARTTSGKITSYASTSSKQPGGYILETLICVENACSKCGCNTRTRPQRRR